MVTPFRRDLARQGFRQGHHGGAERVRQNEPLGRFLHRERCVGDDPAPAARRHLRKDAAAEADDRQEVSFERRLPRLISVVRKQAGRRSAGVVDENVDPSEPVMRCREDPIDAHGSRLIGGDRENLCPGLLSDAGSCFVDRFAPPGTDRHRGALLGQPPRERVSQPPARASDNCHSSFQPEVHDPSFAIDSSSSSSLSWKTRRAYRRST